jgi:hypothetical protein
VSLLRRRAKARSCTIHGDNGCEIQGEAGLRERVHDKRAWTADVGSELDVPKASVGHGFSLSTVSWGGCDD